MSVPTDVLSISNGLLDAILSIQTAVARLGEKPLRAWWNSDIADADGGADLLKRLIGTEMVPLAILEGVLLSAARTEENLLAAIPAPQAYSLFCPEPELRVALRRRIRHFKSYPDELPDGIRSLVLGAATAEGLATAVESAAGSARSGGAVTPSISHDRTSFGIEVRIGDAGGGDHAVTRAAALARVALSSPRGQYTLAYYRETPHD